MRELIETLDGLGEPRLLVLGDVMLDRHTWGAAERLSPEAPAPVLRADRSEHRPGGAAAVAVFAAALGAEVRVAGVVGDDAEGELLRRCLEAAGVGHIALLRDPSRPTTLKERYLARGPQPLPHHLLRVDREGREPLVGALEDRLLRHVEGALAEARAVLVADHAKGACTPRLLQEVIALAHDRGVPVLVDPARLPDFARYRGAHALLPNRAEAEAAAACFGGVEDALRVAPLLCRRYGTDAVLLKLDRDGMVLAQDGQPAAHFPARPRRVADVTGAGDMVLAAAGACRAAALPWPEAVRLANAAAGLEVERLGAAPVGRGELRAELLRAGRPGAAKVTGFAELLGAVAAHRREGRRVVFTNGCFDLLHAGHLACLEAAAALGDALVVAVNADAAVRRLKGPGRPVVGEADRAALVAALGCVDHVTVFDGDTPHELLRQLRPDVLAKGGTYAPDQVVGREVVEAYGGRVAVTSRRDGLSTTHLLARCRAGRPCPAGTNHRTPAPD